MSDENVGEASASVKKEVPSRGWVDNALDKIKAAMAKGVSLDALAHDVKQTVESMFDRPEGKRALGGAAHELDHVKAAVRFVNARLQAMRDGEE